ncbi:MAG: tetratricopeptide repeat protein [bacterium]|nr:tetratricopeptide repeat protein [bacterium]
MFIRKLFNKNLILITGIGCLLLSCNRIDNSNPKSVMEGYCKNLWLSKHFKKCYNLISTKSKELTSLDEFMKYYEVSDSLKGIKTTITNVIDLEKDFDHPTYRRYKVESFMVNKSDTTKSRGYITLINENGKWKIVWNKTITQVADEKFDKGDYSGAIKLYEKAIELNPFNANSYSMLAWCYSKSDDLKNPLTYTETLNKISSNIKYAISLEPDNAVFYNSLAMYYHDIVNNPDLAIENMKKAVEYSLNEEDKVTYYANISISCQQKKDYINAIINIEKAIEIDSLYTVAWMRYGDILLEKGNYQEAKEKLEKALSLKPTFNFQQKNLYISYAKTCYNLEDYQVAKEYVLKALEIEPDDYQAKLLFEQINYHITER